MSKERMEIAKFCGKCGSKLDEVAGLCPSCNVNRSEKYSEELQEVAEKSRHKLEVAQANEKPINNGYH